MARTSKRGGCGRNIVIIGVVLVVACIACAGIAWAVAGPTITNLINQLAVPLSTSNDFMNAVEAKDYTKAYGLIHPSQQTAFGGSSDGMQQLFTSNGWEPSSFTLTNIQSLTSGQAVVNGAGTFGGTTKYVTIILQKDGDTWKIAGFNTAANPPTAIPSS